MYELAPESGSLRQGEVLANVVEPRAVSIDGGEVKFVTVSHPLAIVLSQDCDVERDFDTRYPAEGDHRDPESLTTDLHCLAHILLCDAFDGSEYRALLKEVLSLGGKDWKWLVQNQNERFHYLDQSPETADQTSGTEVVTVDDQPTDNGLALDFRGHYAVPPQLLYHAIESGETRRVARLPEVVFLHLIQRFHSYQSRVPMD